MNKPQRMVGKLAFGVLAENCDDLAEVCDRADKERVASLDLVIHAAVSLSSLGESI